MIGHLEWTDILIITMITLMTGLALAQIVILLKIAL